MPSKLDNDDDTKERNKNMKEDEISRPSDSFSGSKVPVRLGDDSSLNLSKMYQNWFLDYASYVILERAVPHISDGLKPVQIGRASCRERV